MWHTDNVELIFLDFWGTKLVNLTCRFIDGFEATILVLPVPRVPTAPRFAEESERRAAATDVANTPAVTKE